MLLEEKIGSKDIIHKDITSESKQKFYDPATEVIRKNPCSSFINKK